MNKEANRQPPGKKVATPSRQSRERGSKVSGVLAPASRQLPTSAALTSLAGDIRRLIESARQQVARAANAALTTLYWQIGVRIRQDVLKERRADYGAEIVSALGRQLEQRYGRGFGEKNLRRMLQFAEAFPNAEIVAALRRQLGWAHFKTLIPIKDPLKRDFYAEMCRAEASSWATAESRERVLERGIRGGGRGSRHRQCSRAPAALAVGD